MVRFQRIVVLSTMLLTACIPLNCQIASMHAPENAPQQDPSDVRIEQEAMIDAASQAEDENLKGRIIDDIIIEGNKYVQNDTILTRIPYQKGGVFDPEISSAAIDNVYALGYFRQVKLEGETHLNNRITLHVVVEEKKLLEELKFVGNKSMRSKAIKEKLHTEKITSIDEETLRRLSKAIQKLYREENRHLVEVSTEIVTNSENPDKATGIVTIHEGPKSTIKRVNFVGNKNIPSRKLRNILFTRENWLCSFMDSAGSYQEQMLEQDKHRLEYFYRDNGYLMAKVGKPSVVFSDDNKEIEVTFSVNEGQRFTIRNVHAIGDEIYGEDELMPLVILKEGESFSQSKLVTSMNKIKDLYGEKGYIYADVYPQVKPDETTLDVDVTFHVERGNKLYANRIIITGNKTTRDKVIRRQLEINEGELITTKKLARSQNSVEYLSFFEKDGVQWKVHRISDELADLEMNVKETKTGNLNFMLSYGTDQYNPKPSLRGTVAIQKSNLFGKGWDIGGSVQADRHHIKKLETHFFDPHIFDSNVSTGLNFYKRWDEYDQWTNVDPLPTQRVLGGNVRLGFWLPKIDKHLQLVADIGLEDIRNNNPHARGALQSVFEPIVRRTFQKGFLKWFGLDLVKDTRDHQVYPKSGYKITIGSKIAPPFINSDFSFLKAEVEGSYYTELIEKFIMDDSLVLGMHAKMGNISSLTLAKPIPYKELFHMGGQSTVRGFTWGGIGPAWFTGDPLGARNAIQLNTELIFPLIPDYSMKAHIFYDTGAGWNTPKIDIPHLITNNGQTLNPVKRDTFNLRHSIGFGLNLLKPVPAKIDWGFKVDRRKQDNESPHEFHLSMNYAW